MENKMSDSLLDTIVAKMILQSSRVNACYENRDVYRNRTNYGEVIAEAEILRMFGHKVEVTCYGEGDYLRIGRITINGQQKFVERERISN